MIFEKFWKNSLKSPFLIRNQYFHQKLFFYLFFLIFVALLGKMYRNMQKNYYLNGRPYLRAKSTSFSRFAIFCMSEAVLQIVHRVLSIVGSNPTRGTRAHLFGWVLIVLRQYWVFHCCVVFVCSQFIHFSLKILVYKIASLDFLAKLRTD